jgi:endonuclease-3
MDKDFIIASLKEMIKDPKCELNYTSDYSLLIAILLSAQCLDKNVNKVTPILFSKYPTLLDLKNANVNDLEKIIHPLGLSNNKSKAIKNLATTLVDSYNGIVPNNRETLSSLPGVGIKTSGVFLAEFYHQNYLPIDTHIKRVSYRLGITNENDSITKIEETLSKFFNYENLNEMHLRLVLFGRYICKSKNPDCNNCKFKGKCTLTR